MCPRVVEHSVIDVSKGGRTLSYRCVQGW